jgi:predicted transcriptional regulator
MIKLECSVVSERYHEVMAMTLRLTDEEAKQLRKYAESTGRSMQDVARQAIRDFVRDRNATRDRILRHIVEEDRALLDLLAE